MRLWWPVTHIPYYDVLMELVKLEQLLWRQFSLIVDHINKKLILFTKWVHLYILLTSCTFLIAQYSQDIKITIPNFSFGWSDHRWGFIEINVREFAWRETIAHKFMSDELRMFPVAVSSFYHIPMNSFRGPSILVCKFFSP